MSPADLLGWLAAALTLQTFVCRDMRRLRTVAIGANLAFIAYAASTHLWPVLALHLVLAPLNTWRLLQLRASAAPGGEVPAAGAGDDEPAPVRPDTARRSWRHARVRRGPRRDGRAASPPGLRDDGLAARGGAVVTRMPRRRPH